MCEDGCEESCCEIEAGRDGGLCSELMVLLAEGMLLPVRSCVFGEFERTIGEPVRGRLPRVEPALLLGRRDELHCEEEVCPPSMERPVVVFVFDDDEVLLFKGRDGLDGLFPTEEGLLPRNGPPAAFNRC